jgi:hypothetical protein
MDQSVLAAIARWPGVPDVYGWLSLSARGQWRLRGEPIANPAIRDFIGRNYAADQRGCWFFQNGPQRVYVTLELAPWIYRIDPDGHVLAFTGVAPRRLQAAALVDGTTFVLLTELGPGSIDDRDADRFLAALTDVAGRALGEAAIEQALDGGQPVFVAAARCGLGEAVLPLPRLAAAELGAVFGFRRQPEPG